MHRLLFSSAMATLMALLALPSVAASDSPRSARGPDMPLASIVGSVWRDGNVPVPGAHVRLRNYSSGKLEDGTQANELGRFEFRSLEGGHYVVEIVSEAGKVLAVGQPLSVAAGETVATFVRLARVPRVSGLFRSVAAASVATASAVGLTALAPQQDGCAAGQCCR